MGFNNITIVYVLEEVLIEFIFGICKDETIKIMNGSILHDKIFFQLYIKLCESNNLTYYQRNREILKNGAKDYYKNDKERLKEQARDKQIYQKISKSKNV